MYLILQFQITKLAFANTICGEILEIIVDLVTHQNPVCNKSCPVSPGETKKQKFNREKYEPCNYSFMYKAGIIVNSTTLL